MMPGCKDIRNKPHAKTQRTQSSEKILSFASFASLRENFFTPVVSEIVCNQKTTRV